MAFSLALPARPVEPVANLLPMLPGSMAFVGRGDSHGAGGANILDGGPSGRLAEHLGLTMNPGDFLTESEVAALTGESLPSRQAAALARSGFPFIFTGSAVRLLQVAAMGRQMLPEVRQTRPGGTKARTAAPATPGDESSEADSPSGARQSG